MLKRWIEKSRNILMCIKLKSNILRGPHIPQEHVNFRFFGSTGGSVGTTLQGRESMRDWWILHWWNCGVQIETPSASLFSPPSVNMWPWSILRHYLVANYCRHVFSTAHMCQLQCCPWPLETTLGSAGMLKGQPRWIGSYINQQMSSKTLERICCASTSHSSRT